jgi:perosamine synthetase
VNIPLFRIYWDDDDVRSVTKVIRQGSDWASGPLTDEFENKISDYVGAEYCVTFNSGTSALHATLQAKGISSGDEVIVPSFTFISTANSVLFVGAAPVFADIEKTTFGLDPDSVNEKITRKTRAIIPVHYGGCPCHIREIREIANDKNILLIEDAAESIGSKIGRKKIGTYGDATMFSFCQNKIISTGEGGAITTDSKELYNRLKMIRSHGREDCKDFFSTSDYVDYKMLGYNFRLSEMAAALGISQIDKIDKIIRMRRDKADYLSKMLKMVKFIQIPEVPRDYFSVYQLFTIWVRGGKAPRDNLITWLKKHKIASKVYFFPVHQTTFYRHRSSGLNLRLPVTEEASDHVLTLPLYPTIDKEELDYMIDVIRGMDDSRRKTITGK